MPVGLKFQRKHRYLGYKLKYFYYCVARRNILQKKLKCGEENKNKKIYVIKPDYQDGVEGLLSLVYRQVLYIDYARKKGFVPFIDWKNFKTQYYDGINNAWEYFFKQPSQLTESEVYASKCVYLSGWTYRNINPLGLFEAKIFFDYSLEEKGYQLLKNNLNFSDEVIKSVEEEEKKLEIEKCIGLYVRGTDYIKLRPSGEYIQPNIEQVKRKAYEFIEKYKSPIFLVTEDGEIYDELVQTFGKKIRTVSFDTFIYNYEGKDVLSKSHVLEDDKKKRGQKYLVKMILLAKCKYFIGSITQGSKFSYSLNGGRYEDEFVFDLGLY